MSYTNITGRLPFIASCGNEYIFIGYNVYANIILATPIKNRKTKNFTAAWKLQNDNFPKAGVQPNTYVISNEASNNLTQALGQVNTRYQLVPLHKHRTNLVEHTTQTFESHLKAGLASVELDFPIGE